jgi:hypothetical protein
LDVGNAKKNYFLELRELVWELAGFVMAEKKEFLGKKC